MPRAFCLGKWIGVSSEKNCNVPCRNRVNFEAGNSNIPVRACGVHCGSRNLFHASASGEPVDMKALGDYVNLTI